MIHGIAQGLKGAPTELEVELAELIVDRVPSIEKVRLVSSGTEATMHAVRLARGATGRDKVIKFEGCYHGAHDAMLVKAGSGVATFSAGRAATEPGSPGVPRAVAENTLVAPFNDLDAVEALLKSFGDDVAAVILEPVAGNMGCIPPLDGFLEGLRELCDEYGALLIFDEVMTGFRVARGCAQERFGVTPDLTTLGKVVGGGYPLAAFGGRADLMNRLAPMGEVYQAGTLSGNPVAAAAGIATLRQLDHGTYAHLESLGQRLEARLADAVAYHGCSMHRVGSMITIFMCEDAPTDFQGVLACDLDAFATFFRSALAGGVYLPPSQFEAAFLSARMTPEQIDRIADGITAALVATFKD